VVEPHPSTDPMPSPPRQSSPSPIPFSLAPSSGVASTDPTLEIPSSSRPYEPVLQTITSPIRDDDTGGGSFHKSPPSPPLATPTRNPTVGVAEEPLTLTSLLALFPTFLQRIATLEAELKATKILHRDAVVLFAKRIKKLEIKLKNKKRKLVLNKIALNLTNEEWIGLVDQVWANPTLSAELLGADVSEDTFSIRMVELMNQRRKAIAEIKAKAKRDRLLTPAQKKEYMRAFNVYNKIRRAVDLATAKYHHQQLKQSGETLESSESKKLKSSHSTEQSAELPDTTSVSAGATLAAGDPISVVPTVSAVPSVSATSSIPAETPIAAGVSTTAGVSESASVPIIDLLDSPPKATSLPLDPETAEQAKYLRQVSDDDEPAEPVSLSLVSDIRRADLMVLYGMVLDKYKLERATGIGLGLWSDLRTLITAREDRDASIIWDDQD
nr:hypothetical protein [Tanacetum cinerariifolium]